MAESLRIPNTSKYIHVGDIVKLGRFEREEWLVCFGWFSFSGNRPWCGWFLKSADRCNTVKPLLMPDLEDIYVIKSGVCPIGGDLDG